MTPDQYRREGAEAMREAAAKKVFSWWPSKDTHDLRSLIRAIDVDEVLAKVGDERCPKWGHPRNNHPYRHPFVSMGGHPMTTDLTTITTPFGLLDEKTQAQLRAAQSAGMRIEFHDTIRWRWASKMKDYFAPAVTYRLAPAKSDPRPIHSAPDAVARLVKAARAEADKAMRKFPQPNYVISKVAEEAGEVVKAAIHCAEGRETPSNVRAEIVQAMAMLIRLYLEGDQVHGLPSIAEYEDTND